MFFMLKSTDAQRLFDHPVFGLCRVANFVDFDLFGKEILIFPFPGNESWEITNAGIGYPV
jgi:hypothetical protein